MSELISGKEALIALANDQEVECRDTRITFNSLGWSNAFGLNTNLFFSDRFKFRLKPHTIKINGIEVPAPFKPKDDCVVYILDDSKTSGYRSYWYELDGDSDSNFFGFWEKEEDIKLVVEALRSIFQINTK